MQENASREVRRRQRESGQALVEFALILPLFLMIVVGIIQFGVGLNYWMDLQRIANQGARWAVVNCGQLNACGGDLEQTLLDEVISSGNNPTVDVCFIGKTGATATVGDSVSVRLTTEYTFAPIVRVGTIDLNAVATMRVEQKPTQGNLQMEGQCP